MRGFAWEPGRAQPKARLSSRSLSLSVDRPHHAGVLLYEMLAGYPPFCADSPLGVFDLALHADPTFPPHVPSSARRCISELLRRAPHTRLGGARGARGGAADVASHAFFSAPPHQIDWRALLAREVAAPVIPVVPSSSCVDLASIEAVLPQQQEHDELEWSSSSGVGNGAGGSGGTGAGAAAAAAGAPPSERLRAGARDADLVHQRRGSRSSSAFAEFEQLRQEDPNAETQKV